MSHSRIADYGLIGDTRTAALVSSDGSIDWMCLPRFDSKPVFARLVGGERAGCFAIRPDDLRETSRRYRDGSAVLETTWRTGTGRATAIEGMVVETRGTLLPQALLVRRVECVAGRVALRLRFDPRLGLPGGQPRAERRSGALVCTWGSLAVALWASPEVHLVPGRDSSVVLDEGSVLTLVLSLADRSPIVLVPANEAVHHLEATDRWWRGWSGGAVYDGAFREALTRSLITLRLLTYSPSGAPVAAPTTSLPETVGGSRNWDYRFSWPRDASIGVAAFLAVGMHEEAHSFMHWLLHASRLTRPRLQVLYTLYGKPPPPEREVFELPGYAGSRPVRIGNAAGEQHQLDVYGWVTDAAWALVLSGRKLHTETWRAVAGFADFVAEHWREPDAGVWEIRDKPAHYVHSKLMGWLALDRAIRISDGHRVRSSRRRRWAVERAALAADIRMLGRNPERSCYSRTYGSNDVDAALLLLPILGFDDPSDRTVLRTIEAIRKDLGAGGPLLYRYFPETDGLEGVEGAFLPCSFWLVQALAALGKIEEAVETFDELLSFSNDVGLMPEEIDPSTKAHLGNFPQALTHAAAVQAALAIEEASQERERRRGSSRRPRAR